MDFDAIADRLTSNEVGPPKYEQIAAAIEDAIGEGRLRPGDRLPTVRWLSTRFGVSPTTITSAFSLLNERGLISPEVGRGTFISKRVTAEVQGPAIPLLGPRSPAGWTTNHQPWRKRTLTASVGRLHRAYPDAVDCSTGRPDPGLLPTELIRSAWAAATSEIDSAELQYSGPEPVPELVPALLCALEADHIKTSPSAVLIGSSAQQWMVLCCEIAELKNNGPVSIAIEEPGYPTILDSYERRGARLLGVPLDECGAVPTGLRHALDAGANMVLLTPRAQNPTGASWTRERFEELADVLLAFPDVLIVEDDQFAGIARPSHGSLANHPRLRDRVVYIRSFSKSLGPDLRMAAAIAGGSVRGMLQEAKTFADGWSSRLIQRVLARLLSAEELTGCLEHAKRTYEERRRRAAAALNAALLPSGGGVWPNADGVNLWVRLPQGSDTTDVLEEAADRGVLAAPGDPFFIRPGHTGLIRFNACSVEASAAERAARALGEAILLAKGCQALPVHV